MKTPEKPKRLCEDCDHYEVCQAHSHAGILHALNADRCGLYSDRTHDRKRIAVLEQVVEEGNRQIEQLERERDAAVSELVGTCQVCRWEETEKCASCHFNADAWNVWESNWEWRGAKEE